MASTREQNEILHGKLLAHGTPEDIWGWGSPAGKIRAQRRANFIISGAALDENSNVLEIGCGSGLFTEHFAQTGATILAIDISSNLLTSARSRGLPENRITFSEKSFDDIHKDGRYDAVIGSSVLHHLEIETAFSQIYRLLKPGGRMSFAEPNMLNPQIFMERKFRNFFPQVSPDETAFIRYSLKKVLKKVGFADIRILPFDWLHPSTPIPLIKAVKNIGQLLENIPIIREFSGSLYIQCCRPQ